MHVASGQKFKGGGVRGCFGLNKHGLDMALLVQKFNFFQDWAVDLDALGRKVCQFFIT
jgi:hypothetical protein